MTVIDKRDIFDRIEGASLELGCGMHKRNKNAIGVDTIDYECVDIVGDALDVLRLIPDHSIAAIESRHFLEHIADVDGMLGEMARVLRVGGKLEIIVPHFSNPYYYSDATHKSFFGLYSLSYFAAQSPFRRAVPHYERALHYRLDHVDLLFRSAVPFYFRHGLKKLLQVLFNANNYTREFYEENLCYIVPCYEIKYQLTRIADRNNEQESGQAT